MTCKFCGKEIDKNNKSYMEIGTTYMDENVHLYINEGDKLLYKNEDDESNWILKFCDLVCLIFWIRRLKELANDSK